MATLRLYGREVHQSMALAQDALSRDLPLPESRQPCRDLGLSPPGAGLADSQPLWLVSDHEAHRVQGQELYLLDLARNVLHRQQPGGGILCWLFDKALAHAWVAELTGTPWPGKPRQH